MQKDQTLYLWWSGYGRRVLSETFVQTKTTISLSSGESELHGIAQGMAKSLQLQSLMANMGWKLPITVHSDATAAIGIACRKSVGKFRHPAVTDLWMQDNVKSKKVGLTNVLGTDNPADIFI